MADAGRVEVTLTPRQFVLLKHPQAFCETNGEDFQVVVLGKYAAATVLGVGGSRRTAWRNAADKQHKGAK